MGRRRQPAHRQANGHWHCDRRGQCAGARLQRRRVSAAGGRELRAGVPSAQLGELWERILAAYERALELEPQNPNYLNDTAVVLHYYLIRDLDRARALYEETERCAERRLGEANVPPRVRCRKRGSWDENCQNPP